MKRNGAAVAEPFKDQKLKPGWRLLRFDEIAENITDRVDDPSQAGVDRYVGLEHLDPESLKIRRWGAPTDVEATKLRFQPGDIIFGKRRAYQRKLAVADFEGICSAHAMVLRAKQGGVIPDFLPYFMQSDVFFERALAISVGSLSPTINWRTLAEQRFVLPPESVQEEAAELLKAVDDTEDCWGRCKANLLVLRRLLLERLFNFSELGTYRTVALGEIAVVVTGGTPSRQHREYWNGNIPWVKTGEIRYTTVHETEEHITDAGLANCNAKLINAGAILLALYGQGPTLGRVARLGIPAAVNQACAAVIVSDFTDTEYVYYFLEREYENIRKLARGAAQPNLNLSLVRGLEIPLPDVETQKRISSLMKTVDNKLAVLDEEQSRLRTLRSELMSRFARTD